MREDVAPQALTERHQISLAAAKNLQPGGRRRNVLLAQQSPMNLGADGEGRIMFPKHPSDADSGCDVSWDSERQSDSAERRSRLN